MCPYTRESINKGYANAGINTITGYSHKLRGAEGGGEEMKLREEGSRRGEESCGVDVGKWGQRGDEEKRGGESWGRDEERRRGDCDVVIVSAQQLHFA